MNSRLLKGLVCVFVVGKVQRKPTDITPAPLQQLPSHLVGSESVAMATQAIYVLLFAVFDFTVPPLPLCINSHQDREAGGGGGAK